jgi:uncharacterized protein YkwD
MAPHARNIVLLGALVGVLLGVPAPARAGSPGRLLVREINRFRAENGLPPVRVSHALTRSSRRWARHLAASGAPRHAALHPDGRRFDRLGEVIEWHPGARARPVRAVRAWMASGSHRAVLLDRRLRWIGVGMDVGRMAGRRTTFWVARLGER